MQAFKKHTIEPVINARIASAEILDFCAGHMVPKFPTIIPSEPKLANPHMANVQMAPDRTYDLGNTLIVTSLVYQRTNCKAWEV